MTPHARRQAIHATIWRWHFYAGLFVIPFVLLLAVTGAAYLFKPQVERWEERAFQNLPIERAVAPQAQLAAALAAFPGTRFDSYRLPERSGDAAMIRVAMADGATMRDVFVSPQGEVLGSIAPGDRLMELDKRIHGQLLLGKRGSWLVELAASWAIVLVLSGLWLWWPRGRGLAGVVWPRLKGGGCFFWRDLHAVTGFWISGLALVLLVTALPWAGVWGSAFKAARAEMGWVQGTQDWTLGGEAPSSGGDSHARHDLAAMMQPRPKPASVMSGIGLDDIVAKAQRENLAFPVTVSPPGAPGLFDAPGSMDWAVRSDAQNRPMRMTVTYDMGTGREASREGFADGHVIDRVVGYGIAWHEGQLFGWVNQLVGVLTAIGLIMMAVSGFILWRRRKPGDVLGAPPPANIPARMGGVAVILLTLAALLPLLAASLLVLWLFERLLLPHLPGLARWLGVPVKIAA
ncbi:MAG: PepSY-associated TM helix domain-containing protein [Sphingobium sp.]